MLFVQICTVILLSRLFATTWGAVNLALNKPATQSSEYTTSYPAGNAVNGILGDFSHTADGRDVSWWRVNLGAKYSIGSIKIYNREDVSTRLRRTRILTSNATSPTTPSLTSNDWTEVTYQGPSYPGGATTHPFNPPINGQYVAVYYEEPSGLSLKEVEIFDYNYALSQSTDSSSYQGNSPRAVDGALSTVFSTKNELSPWWKVGLGEAILLREVLVFVKDGNCNPGPVNCASRLTNVYILTHPSNTVAEPDTAGNNGWNKCYYSEQARGEYYTVQCDQGSRYPLTRHFSIRSTAMTRVEPRQVEIYGFELPQLSADIDGKADTTTSTSITVSYRPWNQLMTGGFPPTGYTFQLRGGQSKTVPHNSGSPRLIKTFNGLDAGQTYTFTVSCTIQEIACTGPTYSFTASTSCAVPDVPRDITLSPVKVQHSGREKWSYTATWMAPSKANCAGALQYQYNLIGGSTSALQTTTTTTFYIDGDVPFDFIVKAKNSAGFSTPKSTSERSGVLNPQFSSGQITVTADSAYCVIVTWSLPQYPGGTISQYQCKCGGESYMTADVGDRTKQSCNHLPNTQVTCLVRAKNSAGWGNTQSTGITDCAEPDIPGEITLTAVKTQHSSRQRWKYTASWSAPSKVNCADAVQYQYNLVGQPTALQTTTTTIFYLDGDLPFELIVNAKNSVGFSTPRSKSERSGVLNPQFSSGQITVTTSSAYCVTVTWSVPQYPGGAISQYQHRCGSEGWMDAGGDKTKDSCGHQPNTPVTCWVGAKNSAGWGTKQYSGMTDCAVPTVPQTLSLPKITRQNDGRIRWKYSASWQAPISPNCNGVMQYKYGTQGELTSTLQTRTTATFYLDGDQQFEFIVKAKNSVGYSVSLSESGRSDPLVPQFGTNQISLVVTSSECVKLSWTEPQYPGGAITQYQYRCNEDTFTNLELQISNKESCGYEPYTDVTCRFRAGNIAGFSDVQTKVARTLCAAPVFTKAPTATEGYDSVSKRREVMVNVQGVKKHCATLDPIQYKVLNREFSTDSTIRQLNAITKYNITIKATNNLGLSAYVYINVTTGELEPWDGPQITDKYSENKTCAVVEWKEPSQPNGVIIEYQHQCARQDRNYPGWTTTTTTSLSDCGYDAGNLVKCRVKAATAIGYGPVVNVILNITCDNPSAPLFSLSSNRSPDKTATIEIYLQESKHKCTSLKPYIITIRGPEGEWLYDTTNATAGNHTIENAAPFTNYTVTIEATNDDNLKSLTAHSFVTAETEIPEMAGLVMLTNSSCVRLNATKPAVPNGIIVRYTFVCSIAESSGSNQAVVDAVEETGFITLCRFASATLVTCSAAAHNSVGIGDGFEDSVYTKLTIKNADQAKPEVTKERSKGTGVEIKITQIELDNGEISSYMVMLSKKFEGKVKRAVEDIGCTKDSVNNRPGEQEGCYTTAEISSDKVVDEYLFTVGDGEIYGSFTNEKLQPGATYDLYIAAKVDVEAGHEPLVELLDPIEIIALKSNAGTIAGAVVAAFIFAALVCCGVYLLWRFRLKSANEGKQQAGNDDLTELNPFVSSESGPGETSAPVGAPTPTAPAVPAAPAGNPPQIYGNIGVHDRGNLSEPIPVDKLEWYVRTNGPAITQQYEDLKKLPQPIMNAAKQERNKGKCRYKNLYPSDEHRVTLQSTHGNSDFINASFMKGYSRDVKYIAAQGPFTDVVLEDFWLMIWQQRPSAIVMVTRAIESTKMKCLQYWPLEENVVQRFGDFTVTLKGSEMYCDFSMNHLQVTMNGTTRIIPHFNYLSWPDHGVPDIEVFVAFHKLVSSTISQNDQQPLLVHCSAGVGRTGTYIALDYLLEQAKAEGVVDMYDCVKEMRARRPCMIQTVEQYHLLHHALYQSLATESFSCLPSDLDSKVQAHMRQIGSTSDVISAEFLHASSRAGTLNLSNAIAKLPENQNKNRFSEILAFDSTMPYLTNGMNGNYINAAIVDGYKEKKQWIATQLPLSNTISDFWQLMLEQDIKIIVQLEGGQKPFYPLKDGTAMKVEPFTIKRVDSANRDIMKTVNILLHKEAVTRSVQVLVLKNWISETLPTTDAIISLHEAAGNLQQQMYSKKMCVTCLDGSTRSGLFICAYNAIEKLKAEQMVDLYYATVMAKLRRPQFISTIEQYSFLYDVLKDYLAAFGEYANFG